MPRFVAEVEFTFEADSFEAVPAELRRLSLAAEEAGFELRHGYAVPAPPEEDDSGRPGTGRSSTAAASGDARPRSPAR